MQSATKIWNMDSLEKSIRARYWRETAREIFGAHPAIAPAAIFVLTLLGIIICRDRFSSILILILAMHFSKPLLRGFKSRNPPPLPAERVAPPAAWPPGPQSAEVSRLLTVIDQLEKRVVELEAAVTEKEFDWERRLSRVAPPSAGPVSAHSEAG